MWLSHLAPDQNGLLLAGVAFSATFTTSAQAELEYKKAAKRMNRTHCFMSNLHAVYFLERLHTAPSALLRCGGSNSVKLLKSLRARQGGRNISRNCFSGSAPDPLRWLAATAFRRFMAGICLGSRRSRSAVD